MNKGTDTRNHLHVITFDPGGVTGWAHFVVHRAAFSHPRNKIMANLIGWRTGELKGTEHEQIDAALNYVRRSRYGKKNYAAEYRLVTEGFELTQIIGGNDLLIPVRINAILEYQFKNGFQLELEYQSRSLRTSITKPRLKLWGLFPWAGKDSFAAMQHGVTYLRRLKQESNRRPWELK